MKPIFKIEKDSVHLWQAFVPDLLPQIDNLSLLLNDAEKERAGRFRFDLHRLRFVITRAILRYIISLYSQIPSQDIVFKTGSRGKPSLAQNTDDLQFNASHSHDMAIYALTTTAAIGVDIEKMESHFNDAVAERFFSSKEYADLAALPESEKVPAFYRIWAAREAIIKAMGEGLFASLPAFSINVSEDVQTVECVHSNKIHSYYLENFSVDPAYQSAFATPKIIKQIVSWKWSETGPVMVQQIVR